MEVYEPLPQPITSKFGQEIAVHIQQRLHYQWKVIHRFAKTSLPLSHKTSRDFVHICNTYGVDVPSHVSRRLCPWCSVIQLPTITCSTKLQKRTRKSQSNVQQQRKIKNEVVYRCLSCSRLSFREPGAPRPAPRSADQRVSLPGKTNTDDGVQKLTGDQNRDKPAATSGNGSASKSTFSFLASLDRKMSLGSPRASNLSAAGSGGKRKERDDFLAFSTSSTDLTPRKSSSSGALDLLALEASNKKKRRKSGSGGGGLGDSNQPVSKLKHSASLGSLQQMLQKK